MTAKGTPRGPDHFITPEKVVSKERTGTRLTTGKRKGGTSVTFWRNVAVLLVDAPDTWHHVRTYPLLPIALGGRGKSRHDIFKIAHACARRIGRSNPANPSYGMVGMAQFCTDRMGFEAEIDELHDGSLEIYARYTHVDRAA